MNNQPRRSGGTPATHHLRIASERTESLHEVTNAFDQMAKTTSNFTHDMQAVGVKPGHALLMLAGTVGLVLVVAAVQSQ